MPAETRIHPTAIVEDGAALGDGVTVGPFCHVGPDVVLGEGVELAGHVTVAGATTLGAGCKVASHSVLGGPPQNSKHRGGRTTLVIGENTVIREFVTMNTGSDSSRGETRVGPNGFFLAYTHVGHDCVVGRNAVFANGGLTAVHQFVRIGDNAFIAGCSAISGDVIPFALARGNPARLRGLNVVGLRRSGMAASEVRELRSLYHALFDRSSPVAENVAGARERFGGSEKAAKILDFFSDRGKRHFTVPPVAGSGDDADDDAAA